MKILVTGFVSRQANPAKNKRDVMVSWMLAESLRDMGHEVEHRNPTMTEDYSDFDHVFLGLAALHSVGCNRSYGWLAAYLKCQGKTTLYIDDVDTSKVLSGIRVIANDPYKLTKEFYKYRLEYELASQPQWHDWLMQGVYMLRDNEWPDVIIPMFQWGDVEKYRSQLPNARNLIPIDFSSYVPDYVGEEDCVWERDRIWVREPLKRDTWYDTVRPIYHTKQFGRDFDKRPDDHGLALEYAKSWGVIDRGLDNGFFQSRLIYAAQAKALMITRWQNVEALGQAYGLLADTAAGFTLEERQAWAIAQHDSLYNWVWSRSRVKDELSTLIKDKVST